MYSGLIAIDMDGTLLDPQGRLSEANRSAIAELRQRGYAVTLATGRIHASAAYFAEVLGLNTALISHQGALLTEVDGARLHERVLDAGLVQQVIDLSRTYVVERGCFYSNDDVAVEDGSDRLNSDLLRFNRQPPQTAAQLKPALSAAGATKVMFTGPQAELERLYLLLQEYFANQAHIVYMERRFLEVLHGQATKGQTLRVLAERLGIARERVIAIGDEANDIDMIRYAGYGVAMGNAPQDVQKHADFVTISNAEDGVAHALRKFL